MPYHVAKSSECPGDKPWAVIKTSDGSVNSCHATEELAKASMAAIYANEGKAFPVALPTPAQRAQLRAAFPKDKPRIDYAEMDLAIGDAALSADEAERARFVAAMQRARERATARGQDPDSLIPIAISSEHPVLRIDWWSDEDDPRYWEVLDHSVESVDLTYARDGMPFVMSHKARDGDHQHGIVEEVSAYGDRVLRGITRFSRSPRSQEIAQDMRDGIRKKVSVGYVVGAQYEQSIGADGIRVRRYKSWMPLEVSTVPVPADYDVGVGRAQTPDGLTALARFAELHPAPAPVVVPVVAVPAVPAAVLDAAPSPSTRDKAGHEDTQMPEVKETPGGANPATPTPTITVEATHAETQRAVDITNICNQHGLQGRAAEWINSGRTVSTIIGEVNTILAERIKNGPQHVGGVDVPAKDRARYSFARALMLAEPSLQRDAGRAIDYGLEKEIAEQVHGDTPMRVGKGNTMLPYSLAGERDFNVHIGRPEVRGPEWWAMARLFDAVMGRAGIDSATNTTGGPFKFTQPGDFIPLLRNATSVMRAGATVIPGLTGPVTFPKQTGAATAYWVGENPGSDVTASNLVTSTVTLAFKTIQALTSVSRQALFSAASGNYQLDAIIQADMARVIALAIDLAGLAGSGSANQPLGLLSDTNVPGATALGTQGGTMAWTNWVELETLIGDANAMDLGTLTYMTNTKQRGRGKTTAVLGNTASGVPIWTSARGVPDGEVNGYLAIATNQVSRTLVKGTTSVCSAVLFGAFSELLIGMFGGGYEVLVDPYTKKGQNMVEITSWNFCDVANRYPVAFATIKDAL